MDDPGMGERLVDAVASGFPDSKRDLRPVHTFGVGATGYFVASDVARDFSSPSIFRASRFRSRCASRTDREARFNTTAVRTYAEWRRDSISPTALRPISSR
jgi:hypothetical protein